MSHDYNWPTLKVTDPETREETDLLSEIEVPEVERLPELPKFSQDFHDGVNFDGFSNKLTEMCRQMFTNEAAADPDYYTNLERSWFERIRSRSKNGTYQLVQKRSVLSMQSLDSLVSNPTNIPLSFDPNAGLGVSLPLPVSLTDIIVRVLEITEKRSTTNCEGNYIYK